jgi:hypothetical protein
MSKTTVDRDEPESWLRTLDKVIDEEVDREESIRLTVEELDVDVPLSFGADAEQATWRFDGSVTVHVDGMRGPLASWLKLWLEPDEDGE